MDNEVFNTPTRSNLFSIKSIESPYTSMGSGRSSYRSLNPHADRDYSFLRSKAERARSLHESKSKVMDALKGLQEKIQHLETDRNQAESNLKNLASETRDYKELLKQKQPPEQLSTSLNDSHGKDLENQLGNAQSRCEVLEKQLEYMRTMMNKSSRSSGLSLGAQTFPISPDMLNSPAYSQTSTRQLKHTSQLQKSPLINEYSSPTLEKLNNLQLEHMKLTASQSITENKLRELEEKILEERHQRKLLQDKAKELQHAVEAQKPANEVIVQHRKAKRRKKSINPSQKKEEVSPKASLKDHYLMDFSNIPFVVGKSATRSHSLGANIQNVLSIMKSHSNLCSCSESKSSDMNDLLVALQDELAQLGFAHHELVLQMNKISDAREKKCMERELDRVMKTMETKGNQVNTIRSHVEKLAKTKKKRANSIGTSVATGRKPSTSLVLLKNAQRLQETLRKDDLKWE